MPDLPPPPAAFRLDAPKRVPQQPIRRGHWRAPVACVRRQGNPRSMIDCRCARPSAGSRCPATAATKSGRQFLERCPGHDPVRPAGGDYRRSSRSVVGPPGTGPACRAVDRDGRAVVSISLRSPSLAPGKPAPILGDPFGCCIVGPVAGRARGNRVRRGGRWRGELRHSRTGGSPGVGTSHQHARGASHLPGNDNRHPLSSGPMGTVTLTIARGDIL